MPPAAFIDPAQLEQANVLIDRGGVAEINPHRHEFHLLDAVLELPGAESDQKMFAGFHEVTADAWWTRGHIPGRPLFPGVLMIETAAQLASYLYTTYFAKSGQFLGFTAVDNVKFRGVVEPPCRFYVVGRATQVKPRRVVCDTQGFVNGTLVFEGTITGMPV